MLLPADPPRGGRWADHRTVINGIFFRARAGCPWRDLRRASGTGRTVCSRHRRWSLDETWEQILDGLRAGCDEAEGKDWTVSADSAVARAHQQAPRPAAPGPLMTARGLQRMTRNPAGRRSGGPAAG